MSERDPAAADRLARRPFLGVLMRQQNPSDGSADRRAGGRTLSSRLDWSLYAMAWLVFAAGFAAVFWLQQRAGSPVPIRTTVLGALRVVLPAALLGIGVIRFCERVPLTPSRRLTAGLAHVVGALAFPALWIISVNVLNNVVSGAASGRVPWRFPPIHVVHWHCFTGVLMYAALAGLTSGRSQVRDAERRRLRAEERLLRGQLDPHFLFNTMHTVFALAQMDADAGEDAMTRFSRLMRFALLVHRDDRDQVTLEEEWAFSEDYLHLEALRSDGRVQWTMTISERARDCLVPPLLLQPLIENAVRHGVRAREEACVIHVDARCDGPDLVIRVADNGPGTAPGIALGSPGVGLRSVRSRLALLLPRPGTLAIESSPDHGFAVMLRLPAVRRARIGRLAATSPSATASVS